MDEPTRISPAGRLREDDPFGFENDAWLALLRAGEHGAARQRIGPYELLGEVGRGGQGIVYRALQPHTHRQIAVKRLLEGALSTPAARLRFEREVETVTSLNHPNIVTVFAMEIIDGIPLLAMEWLDGQPFHRWALDGSGRPREPRETLALFLQACDAVHYAHQRGVIHRDLKPANIFVCESTEPVSHAAPSPPSRSGAPGGGPVAKILDFGLAKRFDEATPSNVTMSDEFVGTPAYASPEQIRLDHAQIDVRTDVYSLGVVLFQGLTGQMPYELPRNLAQLIETIEHAPPRRPSSLNPRIDRELDNILLKTLEKDRARRYQSVDALGADIRRYLAGEAVLAHPPSALYQFRKLVLRHRVASGLAAALLLSLIIFAAVGWKLRGDERAARLAAEDEKARLRQASSFPLDVFGALVRAGGETMRSAALAAVAEAERRFHERLIDAGGAKIDIGAIVGRCFLQLGEPERARAAFLAALDAARAASGGESESAAELENELAQMYALEGRLPEAETLLQHALATRTARLGPAAAETTQTRINLGVVLHMLRRFDDAEAALDRALRDLESRGGRDARNIGIVHSNLGLIARDRGDFRLADERMHKAIERFRSLSPRADADLAEALFQAGQLRLAMRGASTDAARLSDSAVSLLRESLDIRRRLHGDASRPVAVCAHALGAAAKAAGDFRSAEEALRIAETAWRAAAPGSVDLARTLSDLADVLIALDRPGEAEPVLRETLAISTKLFGESHEQTRTLAERLAQLRSRIDAP
ncbi:MAG: hypothetical protein AMXMBFR47_03020 [Planctomycetota bacterium]